MTNVSPELAGELSDIFLEAVGFTGLLTCFLEAPGPSRTRRPVNAKITSELESDFRTIWKYLLCQQSSRIYPPSANGYSIFPT